MDEMRCTKCYKLLCFIDDSKPYTVQIKCPKCKTINTQGRTDSPDLKRFKVGVPVPTFSIAEGMKRDLNKV